jgi:uncharacterized protein YukE
MGQKLKHFINRETNEVQESFIGKSGKEYFITNQLNIKRYAIFQKLSLNFGYGVSFQAWSANMTTLMSILNAIPTGKKTFSDAILHCHAMQKGLLDADNTKYETALYMSTLFINTEDEDITEWSQELAEKKIDDWLEYDVNNFFLLIQHSINGLKLTTQELENSMQMMNKAKIKTKDLI